MKIIVLLILISISIFAGSKEAVIECHSGTGRTLLHIEDMDLEGNFQSGFLMIDSKKLIYSSNADAVIVSHLNIGVYTVSIVDKNGSIYLEFYALPDTVKKHAYAKGLKFIFQANIDSASTDPRSKERLNKRIQLNCKVTYDWREI